MLKLKPNINLNDLRKYGFKLGSEYPDPNDEIFCNSTDKDDFWLLPMHPDEPDKIHTVEESNHPIWYIHIYQDKSKSIWIDCEPNCTYHISISDMELMFHILYQMITDKIIYSDYTIS